MDLSLERLEQRIARQANQPRALRFARRHPLLVLGLALLAIVVFLAIFAPWLCANDPTEMNVVERLKPPSAEFLLGTDALIFETYIIGFQVDMMLRLEDNLPVHCDFAIKNELFAGPSRGDPCGS